MFRLICSAIKTLFHSFAALAAWLINLFNPPPLESLNLAQKTSRVLLLSVTLVVASVIFSMVAALGIFIMERGHELGNVPEFYHGLLIILVGIGVNVACVFVLIQIKKADTKVILPPKK